MSAFSEEEQIYRAKMKAEWDEKAAKADSDRAEQRVLRRKELEDNPFDPRTEVSADAHHIAGRIVKHLWIIVVLLPVVLGILYAILNANK